MTTVAPEVLTFGCRLNSAESETMQKNAAAAGLQNTVIINTCAVTAEAERQAGQAIRRLKRENPSVQIIVTGCAAQIDPQKFAVMTEVDHVIGNDVKLLPESFRNLLQIERSSRRKPGSSASDSEHSALAASKSEMPSVLSAQTRLKLDPGFRRDDGSSSMQRAFVQVQNGCDHRCTFCIIPFGRGDSRSLAVEDVIQQTKARVKEGFKEIVFTGVDIASYGRDLNDGSTLGSMMGQVLAAVPELQRLRLSSLDPAAVDEGLWRLIAEEPRLMPHLHLSLQAGDNMILKRMKRRHSREDVLHLCARARTLRPDIVFGADIIAGFPTESEAMFENTYDLVERCGLTWLHVFPYSSRKGTPAAKMPQIHGSVRKERADKLREWGEKAVLKHQKALIGQTVKVLVENNGIGCTPHFAKLKLMGDAPVGQIVDAQCVVVENNTVVADVRL